MTAQKDIFTKRWRRVKPPKPTELQIHIGVVEYVRRMGKRGVVMAHFANGEKRDKRTAVKLKAMGVLPGAADLVFFKQATWSFDCLPEVLFLELKAPGEKQTEAQKSFAAAVTAAGCRYHVADSLDDAIEVLEEHEFVRPRQAIGRGPNARV